jgi:hypothetical protein
MTEQPVFQSRRERREAEKRSSNTPASPPPKSLEEPTLSMPASSTPSPDIFLEPVKAADFGSTSNLGTEPITASIIMDKVPDLDSQPIVITGTGAILKTGSIELPRVDASTGSIAVINAAEQADEALAEDSMNSFVSSVAPIRAAGIAKTRSKTVELTLVTRKGQGQIYAVMSTAVLMITVGALIVAAFMLGIFD